MSEGKLSFKEMCAKFEVTPRTLRYYEYIELLSPERVGRSRFYGARECARMTLILRGRKFGFQLEELRQWLLIYDKEKFIAHNFEGKYLDCGTMSGYINSSKEIGKI